MNMYEDEVKYCKFCNKEKPINEFCKSGTAVKNICRECQNKKQKQIYNDSKKTKQLQQENQQLKMIIEEYERLNKENGRGFKITNVQEYNIDELIRCKDNWNKLKEYIDIKLYNVEYLQKMCGCRIDDEIHIILDIIKKEMQELEQGSDSNE